jgi:glycosyltransferase involved in cell wall biosynthesis
MRVLTVIPHADSVDGLHRAALDFAGGLARRGHSIDVVARHSGDSIEAWRTFAGTVTVDEGLALSPRRPAASLAALARLSSLRWLRHDVVHCHRIDLLAASAALARLAGAALAYHAHNAPPDWAKLPDRKPRAAKRIARLVLPSRYMVDRWVEAGARADRTVHVPYGIDVERFGGSAERGAAQRNELGFGPDEFVIVYIGRIEDVKGVHTLVEAFARLAQADPSLRLVVKGSSTDPQEAPAYRERLYRLAGDALVTWLPHSPDVADVYALADLVVVPSVWQDPSPLVVPEAMASRVPVVASAVGGIPEQVEDLDLELLFPAGDVDTLAQRIRAFRSWREDDPELGERLRAHIVRTRSLDPAAGALEAVLEGIA